MFGLQINFKRTKLVPAKNLRDEPFNFISGDVRHLQTGCFAHNRIDRALCLCTLCDKSDLEDEFNFVLVCSVYDSIRKKYICPFYYKRPRVYKFTVLMQNKQLNFYVV